MLDVSLTHKVFGCVRAVFFFGALVHVSAHGDVKDDVCGVVDDGEALLDGRVDVDVPDGASVHEDEALEVLGREDYRDGAG